MTDSFDPFDLPSSFDPFASQAYPPPPCRRRAAAATPASDGITKMPGAGHGGAGGRLAHFLPPAEPPAPPGTGSAGNDTDTATRLATLQHEVATLTARLDGLQAALDDKFASHQDRLLRAVATLLEQQRARR